MFLLYFMFAGMLPLMIIRLSISISSSSSGGTADGIRESHDLPAAVRAVNDSGHRLLVQGNHQLVGPDHHPEFASQSEIEEWTKALDKKDIAAVTRLIQTPLSYLREAGEREVKMRQLLEPIDHNFKYWMQHGTGVDLRDMLDSLHSVPLVVYKLDPSEPLHQAKSWLDERMIGNRSPVTHDLLMLLEQADWLLRQHIHDVELLETHLYSLNRLKVTKSSPDINKELGRLGIAFYSELGILPWAREAHVMGTPARMLRLFLSQWTSEVQQLSLQPQLLPPLTTAAGKPLDAPAPSPQQTPMPTPPEDVIAPGLQTDLTHHQEQAPHVTQSAFQQHYPEPQQPASAVPAAVSDAQDEEDEGIVVLHPEDMRARSWL